MKNKCKKLTKIVDISEYKIEKATSILVSSYFMALKNKLECYDQYYFHMLDNYAYDKYDIEKIGELLGFSVIFYNEFGYQISVIPFRYVRRLTFALRKKIVFNFRLFAECIKLKHRLLWECRKIKSKLLLSRDPWLGIVQAESISINAIYIVQHEFEKYIINKYFKKYGLMFTQTEIIKDEFGTLRIVWNFKTIN